MRYVTILLCALSLLAACKKKTKGSGSTTSETTPELRVSVQPFFGSDTLKLDSSYTTQSGFSVQFSEIKFYFTDITNGQKQLVDAARFDYRENGTTCFQVNGKAADFSAINGLIGVNASLNHNDPSGFPNNSVLNIMNSNGMHWGWNTGFIFIVIEGRADTIPDGNALYDHTFTYHVGTDAYLDSVSFPAISWTALSTSLSTTWLHLDLKAVLDHPVNPVDIRSEYITHSAASQAALTQKIKSNFLDALTTP